MKLPKSYRVGFAVVGLLLIVLALAFAQTQESVSVDYGSTKSVTLELNAGDTAMLEVTVRDIPEANVATLYVETHGDAKDRVFCGPSPKEVDNDTETFTCVVTPGDAFEGEVRFVALDANSNILSNNTTVELTVTYEELWYSTKAVARVNSTVSVGGHTVVVKNASFLYANLLVDNSLVTAFVNDETEVTKDFRVVFKGYDPDTKEVFLEFRATRPVTASVATPEYYLAAPRDVYLDDKNTATVDVYTNCSAVEYRLKGSEDWTKVTVEDKHASISIDTNVDRVYVRCADDDSITATVYVHTPLVIKVTPDENEFVAWCKDHDYIPKDQCPKTDCTSYCAANGWVKPPAGQTCQFVPVGSSQSGDNNRLLIGIAILVALAVLAYLYKQGKISFPSKKKEDVLEQPRPLEEAHDIQ